jgi:hypothetical protein
MPPRQAVGAVALLVFVAAYAGVGMGLFDGVSFPSLASLRGTAALKGVGRMPTPSPAALETVLQGQQVQAPIEADGEIATSEDGDDVAAALARDNRDAQLVRWFLVSSRAAGDATGTDCAGESAAQWKDGCTFGRRGRWFAGRAYVHLPCRLVSRWQQRLDMQRTIETRRTTTVRQPQSTLLMPLVARSCA